MSPKVTVRGFKKWCIFTAVGGTVDMEWNGMAVKRVGMLGVSVRKMKALTMEMRK
jgi:hypothetical protein